MPGGMQTESTTMIKGVRERTEQRTGYGMDSVNITQCDLRRTIQLSDKTRKYIITPMEDADATSTGATPSPSTGSTASAPSQKGGVITSVTTSTDTGERKEMFGFTARHVKTSIRMESSADACNPLNMHMEQDGWYIDLNFGLNCELGRAPMMGPPGRGGGCRDRFQTRHVGAGRTGFPLIETTIGYDQNDREQYRITKEVADLSRQPLDASLFDIPAGYAEARDSQELMGTPDMGAMMGPTRWKPPDAGAADSRGAGDRADDAIEAARNDSHRRGPNQQPDGSFGLDGITARAIDWRHYGLEHRGGAAQRYFSGRGRRGSEGETM